MLFIVRHTDKHTHTRTCTQSKKLYSMDSIRSAGYDGKCVKVILTHNVFESYRLEFLAFQNRNKEDWTIRVSPAALLHLPCICFKPATIDHTDWRWWKAISPLLITWSVTCLHTCFVLVSLLILYGVPVTTLELINMSPLLCENLLCFFKFR